MSYNKRKHLSKSFINELKNKNIEIDKKKCSFIKNSKEKLIVEEKNSYIIIKYKK